MDDAIRYSDSTKTIRKKLKNYNLYWSNELTKLWQEKCKSEKEFRKCPNNTQIKTRLRVEYEIKKGIFDKHLRNAERAYNRKLADDIEDMNTNDHVQFWNEINRLGPEEKSEIPMSVMREDGSVSDEFDTATDT